MSDSLQPEKDDLPTTVTFGRECLIPMAITYAALLLLWCGYCFAAQLVVAAWKYLFG